METEPVRTLLLVVLLALALGCGKKQSGAPLTADVVFAADATGRRG